MIFPVNCFNFIEFEKYIIESNKAKFYAYLFGRNLDKHLVAEVEFDLKDRSNSIVKIKNKGKIIHPKVLLTLNRFIFNYNG